jgi:hypothetical protein
MHADWNELKNRLRQTLIRTIEVVAILVLDAAILAVGYGVDRIVSLFSNSGSNLYEVARQASGVVFLMLYLAWVVRDMIEFLRRR